MPLAPTGTTYIIKDKLNLKNKDQVVCTFFSKTVPVGTFSL